MADRYDPYVLLHHKVKDPDGVPYDRHLVIVTFDNIVKHTGYGEDTDYVDVCYYHAFSMEERDVWEKCVADLAVPSRAIYTNRQNKFVFFESPGKGTLEVKVNVTVNPSR